MKWEIRIPDYLYSDKQLKIDEILANRDSVNVREEIFKLDDKHGEKT